MFGMRRYRLFLIVAALSAASIYYLSRRGSWDTVDFGQSTLKHDPPQQPTVNDPVVPQPPPPPKPADDVIKPAEPPAKVSSRIESSAPSQAALESTSISTAKPSIPTITGDELLGSTQNFEDDFGDEGFGRLEVDPSLNDGMRARWQKPMIHFPLSADEVITLPSGPAQKIPKIQATFAKESSVAKKDRISKLNTIKESFKHAWSGYKEYGLPHDEVKPISKGNADPFMGWGATLVDTLDTLWVMGLKSEFEEALLEVEKIDFRTSARKDIPLFETVIRYLGGLLAAYDVSGAKYPILLNKTEELAEMLMGAFDTPNRMPITFYNWAPSYTSQAHRASAHAVMSELGSLSVEMTRLAQITKKHEYYDAIARITDALEKWQPDTLIPGLWPLKLDASGCKKAEHLNMDDEDEYETPKPVLVDTAEYDINGEEPAVMHGQKSPKKDNTVPDEIAKRGASPESFRPPTREQVKQPPISQMSKVDQEILAVECTPQGMAAVPNAKSQIFSIGGQADSTYEYFPKMHMLLHGRNQQYESMYRMSAKAIRKNLIFRPMIKEENREILFAAKHELNPKAKTEQKKKIVTYDVTHLSCFVGGMFGLGAKLFGLDDDLELAKQLTDGCVWAYESMPTGVMAESARVVPCPGLDVCTWNKTRWHDALDPQLDERLAAVDAWNKKQKEIYESSKKQALKEAAMAEAADGTSSEINELDTSSKDDVKGKAKSYKREALDDKSSKLSPDLGAEKGPEKKKEKEDEQETEPIKFIPKVALSHDKYIKARIQEERLPPSYTKINARHYGLRPEAIESVFYMWRLTGDDIWRQKGWKMFEAVQSATQTEVANAAMKDVTSHLGELEDEMESFWLAETLKYFYLLFDEPNRWSLDNWVLNTEAHFLKITK